VGVKQLAIERARWWKIWHEI